MSIADECEPISGSIRENAMTGQVPVGDVVNQTKQIEKENIMAKDNMLEIQSNMKDVQKKLTAAACIPTNIFLLCGVLLFLLSRSLRLSVK